MASVLLVDDDQPTLETFAIALRHEHHQVSVAATGQNAILTMKAMAFDVGIIDLRLPDIDGLDLLRQLRGVSPHTAFIIVTGFANVRSAIEAIQLGAVEYLEKPIDLERLLTLVTLVSGHSPNKLSSLHDKPLPHAARRWANIVVPLIHSPSDPKTVGHWARYIAVSSGAIRNWCHTAGLRTNASLKFGRMLRVVVTHSGTRRVGDLLDVVDSRTLARFLQLGARDISSCKLPATVEEYLHRQKWISDPLVLHQIRFVLHEDQACERDAPAMGCASTLMQKPTSDSSFSDGLPHFMINKHEG